jgi:hypothetical protein
MIIGIYMFIKLLNGGKENSMDWKMIKLKWIGRNNSRILMFLGGNTFFL